jgi:putative glutamine amidotransferase
MNVAVGGSLKNLDPRGPINHFRCDLFRDNESHSLCVVCSGSAVLIGIDKVNSIHHQAILEMARCYEVVATAEDGTVEAIRRHRDNFFCLGVQWHPEELPDHHGIFDAFVGSIK